jgi:prepilin-type N-terminal cleavage/methylation domain-containing protein
MKAILDIGFRIFNLPWERTRRCRKPRSEVRNPFTLIEVLIAIAILAIAMGATLSMSGQAKSNLARLEGEWALQHAAEQATEYLLLAPDPTRADLPRGLIPDNIDVFCDVYANTDNLPEYAQLPNGGWILATYQIVVTSERGKTATHIVNKLVREDEL